MLNIRNSNILEYFVKAISLFSGAGGMDVGIKNTGFEIVVANEIDPIACKTFRLNHPMTHLIEGDLDRNLDYFDSLKGMDLVFGGPPCQGFSVAGKMDIHDPRSKLVFSFLEVVSRTIPKSFIMENVKALGCLEKFADVRDEIILQAENLGYKVSMIVLNAKDFGVPQSRERVFFIGLRNSQIITIKDFEKYKVVSPTLREAIAHLGPAGAANNPHITKAKITLAKKPVLRKSAYAGMLFNGQGRPLNPDSWSSTLPASMGGNRTPIIDEEHLYYNKKSWVEKLHEMILNNKNIEDMVVPNYLRRLTIDEAKIIQTFPDTYRFAGTQSKIFTQIGNAVPCKLAEVVSKVVIEKLSLKYKQGNFDFA